MNSGKYVCFWPLNLCDRKCIRHTSLRSNGPMMMRRIEKPIAQFIYLLYFYFLNSFFIPLFFNDVLWPERLWPPSGGTSLDAVATSIGNTLRPCSVFDRTSEREIKSQYSHQSRISLDPYGLGMKRPMGPG